MPAFMLGNIEKALPQMLRLWQEKMRTPGAPRHILLDNVAVGSGSLTNQHCMASFVGCAGWDWDIFTPEFVKKTIEAAPPYDNNFLDSTRFMEDIAACYPCKKAHESHPIPTFFHISLHEFARFLRFTDWRIGPAGAAWRSDEREWMR